MAALSAYGPNPLAGASSNNAKARGWGEGWPHAQTSKMVTIAVAGVKLRVRREVAPLIQTLMQVTEKLGYDVKVGQTWGFADRAIKGTQTPSNHSWGLAVDINSQENPQSTKLVTNLPPVVVHAWEACGFYWGGRYTKSKPDAMHFEYVHTPAQVAADLARARALLNPPAKGSTPSKPAAAPPLDLSLLLKQWRIDKANRTGAKITETLSAQEKQWINYYRSSLIILLHRKKVTFDERESFMSLINRFQRAYSLVPDGIPGPRTADMLRRLAGYKVQA